MTLQQRLVNINKAIDTLITQNNAKSIQQGDMRVEYNNSLQELLREKAIIEMQLATGGRRRCYSVIPVSD